MQRIFLILACLWKGHDLPETEVVEFMGAVYHGGICRRCQYACKDSFICNVWDESWTTEQDGIVHLRGINPILQDYDIVGNWEGIQELAEELRKQSRA